METSGRLGQIVKQLDLLNAHMTNIEQHVNTIVNLAGLTHGGPSPAAEPAECPGLVPNIEHHVGYLCARAEHLAGAIANLQDQLVGQVTTPAVPPAYNPYAPPIPTLSTLGIHPTARP